MATQHTAPARAYTARSAALAARAARSFVAPAIRYSAQRQERGPHPRLFKLLVCFDGKRLHTARSTGENGHV